MTAACNVAGGSGMTCHEFRPNVHHIGILHLVLSSSQSTCTSLRNFIQIGPPSAEKNDVMSIFKMADLSHLGFYGSRNGFFEQPMHDFLWVVNRDYSSKLLSFFRKSRFCNLATDRQTDKQTNRRTDGQARCRSRCRQRRLNNTIQIRCLHSSFSTLFT